jgi:hypothetical protein
VTPGTRTVGTIVAALATLVLGAASRAPWTASPADRSLLRLSWRVQSEAAEQCRPLTEEEKADLPVHMQVPEVCETRATPYVLRVTIDGSEAVSDTVHGAGAREDRPITIFREIPLTAGSHAVHVSFAPLAADDDAEETGEEDKVEAGGIALEYAATIDLEEREVALVTVDPGGRALVRVGAP